MKKVLPIAVILAVFVPVLVLSSGCEEEQSRLDARQNRLFADENIRLNAELERLNRRLDKQIKLLEDCKGGRDKFEKDSNELTTSIMNSFSECKKENLRLRQENESLRAKLE